MILRRYRPRPHAAVRLICLPHAGGSAAAFRPWALAVPPAVEVVAVQYPGRLDRIAEPVHGTMTELVAEVAAAVRAVADRPVALFGHSLGAVVAYEVARVLDGAVPLVRLVVSGRPAPHRAHVTRRHLASDDELWDELRRLGGTDPDVLGHRELRAYVLPVLRRDYRLAETHTPSTGPPLCCGIAAFLGDRDPVVTPDEAAAWRDLTTGDFALAVFPGDHFYLRTGNPAVLDHLLRAVGQR